MTFQRCKIYKSLKSNSFEVKLKITITSTIKNEMLGIFEIISVGNELLNGNTLNTNSHFMMGKISEIGGITIRCTVVKDDIREIVNIVKEALVRRTRWIIITGGLGPTYDDKTLEGVAKALNRNLRLNNDGLEMLKQNYKKNHGGEEMDDSELTQTRLKMVTLPEQSEALENPVGSAPGVHILENSSSIFCLPGVPREMKAIFEDSIMKIVLEKEGRKYTCLNSLKISKGFESSLAPLIGEIVLKYPRVYIKSHPRGFESGISKIDIQFLATSESKEEAKKEARDSMNDFKKLMVSSYPEIVIEEIQEG